MNTESEQPLLDAKSKNWGPGKLALVWLGGVVTCFSSMVFDRWLQTIRHLFQFVNLPPFPLLGSNPLVAGLAGLFGVWVVGLLFGTEGVGSVPKRVGIIALYLVGFSLIPIPIIAMWVVCSRMKF